MKIKKILLLYKKSTYKHYCQRYSADSRQMKTNSRFIRRFKRTHDEHYKNLSVIQHVLKTKKFNYDSVARGSPCDYALYDLIITVGGDGTFLEGARFAAQQPVLGVNSDPQWSVGRFCSSTTQSFPRILEKVCAGQAKILLLNRMKVSRNGSQESVLALNDILICHKNPAAMSRYIIKVSGKQEEQSSSGIWVATAAGSTGAIYSAGGDRLPLTSRMLQFRVRELYRGCGKTHCFHAGLINPRQSLQVTSLMKEGMIYIDGSHVKQDFSFGAHIKIRSASDALRFITV